MSFTIRPMRTQDQIVARIRAVKERDWMGTEIQDLVIYLDYAHAKEFLRPEVTKTLWKGPLLFNREALLKEMEDYMPFAWDKANNQRGLSAGRSMSHYAAWVWLLGDEDKFGDLTEYEFYGKDNLVKICEAYGWDHKQWDNGRRTNGYD